MFHTRSYELELLDEENLPAKDLFQNLRELNTINTLLGGHAVSLRGLKQFHLNREKEYHLLDIGCGGGDNLRVMALWARKNKIKLVLSGVDLKLDCIEFAKKQCLDFPEITFIHADYRALKHEEKKYDIICSALFCHHFNEIQLKELLAFKKEKSTLGFFINDLHRHALAYYSILVLTQLFSKSYLVKNDAPLSVKRGFIRSELESILEKKAEQTQLKWAWAFRWLVIYKHHA